MFVCVFLNSIFLFAQAPMIKWQKSLGGTSMDVANCIINTSDGGFIVVGDTYSEDGDINHNFGNVDYWVVKLSINGEVEWQRTYGGNKEDNSKSIVQCDDGGYLIAGYSRSKKNVPTAVGDVTNNNGSADAWILKINSVGNIEWQKNYGGINYDEANVIIQTSDGGYAFAGGSWSDLLDPVGFRGAIDAWIVKIDINGNIQWQKLFGSYGWDGVTSIRQTSDNGYIVAASAETNTGDVTGNHGFQDYWIVKLDSNGNIEWQKSYGGTKVDIVTSIEITTDLGYIIAGYSESNDGDVSGNNGSKDYWILKTDISGNIEWQKSYGGHNDDNANSIKQTNDGGYVVAGHSKGNVSNCSNIGNGGYWIVKLNAQGNIEWERHYGSLSSFEIANSIELTNDSSYIVSGYAYTNGGDVTGSHGNNDFWVLKLHPFNKASEIKDTICQGDIYILKNGRQIVSSGIYIDTFHISSGCDSMVYICLEVLERPYIVKSISMCNGQFFTLNNGNRITTPGIYLDTIQRLNLCDSIIEYQISFSSNSIYHVKDSICFGSSYTLPNGNKVRIAGKYTDTIKQTNTCDSVVITNLSVFPNTFDVQLKSADTIEAGNSVELKPLYTNDVATSWNWSPATNLSCTTCEFPFASPTQTTQYIVNAKSSNGCEDTASTTVLVRQVSVYIPSAFSPNGDGVNDALEVFAINPASYSLKIYNRWSELVFESNDINTKWNGTYKGEICVMDNYVYVLEVTQLNGKQFYEKGSILLLR